MLHYLHPWTSHVCRSHTLTESRLTKDSKLKQLKLQQIDLPETDTYALTDGVSQLIKYRIFLSHKHQGDPNSWSSSASPLTNIGAPLIVYSRLLGPISFQPVQVFLLHNQIYDLMAICCSSPSSLSGDSTECLFGPQQAPLNL